MFSGCIPMPAAGRCLSTRFAPMPYLRELNSTKPMINVSSITGLALKFVNTIFGRLYCPHWERSNY